jgi:hypothetical protein
MNLKMATMVLAGSVLVHAVVTACTSSSSPPTASAQTTPPSAAAAEVSPETCSRSYEVPAPPGSPPEVPATTVHFAEHAYPGKSKEEIAAHVTHWMVIEDGGAPSRAPDYNGGLTQQLAVYTRDGFAGAGCLEGKTSYFIWSP